tara:strand:- start:290 stop:532 length:243 start_codon:yes stop_codon:yes gene_type:complete
VVLNISHADKARYKEKLKRRKTRVRKSRATKMSDKLKAHAFKQFDDHPKSKAVEEDIEMDEHLKMNDNFMRTGPYKPKEK